MVSYWKSRVRASRPHKTLPTVSRQRSLEGGKTGPAMASRCQRSRGRSLRIPRPPASRMARSVTMAAVSAERYFDWSALLLLAAEGGDEGEHGGVHVEGERGGRAALGHLEEAERVGERIGAAAPVGRGNGKAEQIGGAEVRVVLGGEARFRVVARGPPGEAVAG